MNNTTTTQQRIEDNIRRIDRLTKRLEIAEQYGDQRKQERIHRDITELVEDTQNLRGGQR